METIKEIRRKQRRSKLPKSPHFKEEDIDVEPNKVQNIAQWVFNGFSILSACLTALSFKGYGLGYVSIGLLLIFLLALILEGWKNKALSGFFRAYFDIQKAKKQKLDKTAIKSKEQIFDTKVFSLWSSLLSIIISMAGIFFMTDSNVGNQIQNKEERKNIEIEKIESRYKLKYDSIQSVRDSAEFYVKATNTILYEQRNKIQSQIDNENLLPTSKRNLDLVTRLMAERTDIDKTINKEKIKRQNNNDEDWRKLETAKNNEISKLEPTSDEVDTSLYLNYISLLFTLVIEFIIMFIAFQKEKHRYEFLEREEQFEKTIIELKPYINYDRDMNFLEYLFDEFEPDGILTDKVLLRYKEIYKLKEPVDFNSLVEKLTPWNILVEETKVQKRKTGRGRGVNIKQYKLLDNKEEVEKYLFTKYNKQIEIDE